MSKNAPAEQEIGPSGSATRATKLYRALKEDIIGGALTPRQWLRIDVLRKRYNAGASPLREALNRLSAEGFVDQKDQRGFVVADINERSLDELIFTRCCLNQIMLPTVLERGDTAWEERVVLAHYHLSKIPPFTSDGRVNGDYLIRHREFHMSILGRRAARVGCWNCLKSCSTGHNAIRVWRYAVMSWALATWLANTMNSLKRYSRAT